MNCTLKDAVDAVVERQAQSGDLPDWLASTTASTAITDPPRRPAGRSSTGSQSDVLFEPPQFAAYRIWRGIVASGEIPPGRLVVIAATPSAPMRTFVAATVGCDPGEPPHQEEIRVRGEHDRATLESRGTNTVIQVPTDRASTLIMQSGGVS